MIVIVNYGMGNIGSVLNMLRKIGSNAIVSSASEDISKAEKIILPGVGSFDKGIDNLHRLGLFNILNHEVLVKKKPILGICLGIQLMTRKSEEGKSFGFGWIAADTVHFNLEVVPKQRKLKIPHMGWNQVLFNSQAKLFSNWDGDARFYFVHSYHLVCDSDSDISSTANYGKQFVASIEKENIFGVQFHPEKSHKYGMRLLDKFASI